MMNPFATDLPTNVFVQRAEAETVTVTVEGAVANAAPQSPTVDSVEAAEILGVTVNNLRQIVFKKQLVPSGRKGRRLTFNRDEVNALAERRRK